MKHAASLSALALSLGLALGCSASDEATTTKVSLATAAAGDATIELLADTRLETGLTPVYLRAKNAAGVDLADATLSFLPMMAMASGMNHSAPVIEAPVRGADGLHRCDVVFQMPSGDAGSWSATVGLTRPGSAAAEAKFTTLTIFDSGRGKPVAYTDPSTSQVTKYVVSLNLQEAPKVGLNPVIVTVHRMDGATSFPAVDDATITLDPQMPSMGHGSPGSVNPTLTSKGRYSGQLSFSMAGEWVTTVTVAKAGVTLGAPTFTLTF